MRLLRVLAAVGICIGQCAGLFWLYRILSLDNLRFFLPPVVCFAFIVLTLQVPLPNVPRFQTVASVVIALSMTTLSWCAGMLFVLDHRLGFYKRRLKKRSLNVCRLNAGHTLSHNSRCQLQAGV